MLHMTGREDVEHWGRAHCIMFLFVEVVVDPEMRLQIISGVSAAGQDLVRTPAQSCEGALSVYVVRKLLQAFRRTRSQGLNLWDPFIDFTHETWDEHFQLEGTLLLERRADDSFPPQDWSGLRFSTERT